MPLRAVLRMPPPEALDAAGADDFSEESEDCFSVVFFVLFLCEEELECEEAVPCELEEVLCEA
jgi:hypothetical protein